MAYKDNIEQDLRNALKEKDQVRVSVLRMLLSALNYREIDKKRLLTEDEFYGVVKTLIKQHMESIESFRKGRRDDLAEKEEKELAILTPFAPDQLSEARVLEEIEGAVRALDARDQRDMGKVMRFLMEKLSSRVDGKVLSEMVRKRLSYQRPS